VELLERTLIDLFAVEGVVEQDPYRHPRRWAAINSVWACSSANSYIVRSMERPAEVISWSTDR
jgi:hypothetical protein